MERQIRIATVFGVNQRGLSGAGCCNNPYCNNKNGGEREGEKQREKRRWRSEDKPWK